MSEFSRPLRGLQDLFPSSARESAQPHTLSEVVNLVHPYPGKLWEQVVSFQQVSANVVTPSVLVATSLQGRYGEIIAIDVSHDSATARNLQFRILSPTGQNIFVARVTGMVSALTPGQPSGFQPMIGLYHSLGVAGVDISLFPGRNIVIPSGYTLFCDGNTAAAAYTITASILVINHFLSDVPLFGA